MSPQKQHVYVYHIPPLHARMCRFVLVVYVCPLKLDLICLGVAKSSKVGAIAVYLCYLAMVRLSDNTGMSVCGYTCPKLACPSLRKLAQAASHPTSNTTMTR